jgi:uncharacterized protein (TIGR04255 family)
MPSRFAKIPLVELVAEARWGSVPTVAHPFAPSLQFIAAPPEEFFMRFGALVAARGYTRVERIVPPGFPSPAFQPVYRFRQDSGAQGTTLYQLGANVFSANITPPYHSWNQFRPIVLQGFENLLAARPQDDNSEFQFVSLRYIDRFTQEWTQGKSSGQFVKEVLGFQSDPPEALKVEVEPGREINVSMQFALDLRGGQHMAINLAESIFENAPATMMDTSVWRPGPIAPNVTDIVAALDAAHDVIHRSFIEITAPLHDIMQPIDEG